MAGIADLIKQFAEQKFGEGDNLYDYENAIAAGITPDKTKHWGSRVSQGAKEGLLLKHETHPTFYKTVEGEKAGGYQIYRGPDDRLYSFPKEKVVPTYMTPYQESKGS